MDSYKFEFDWDEVKASANQRKHRISFELASSIFRDPRILTLADLAHSVLEERWFSVGLASTGAMISVAYVLADNGIGLIKIRIISARHSTANEIQQYLENQ